MTTYKIMMDWCAEPIWDCDRGVNLDTRYLPFYVDNETLEKLTKFETTWVDYMNNGGDVCCLDEQTMDCAIWLTHHNPQYKFIWFSEENNCCFDVEGNKL